MLGRNQIESLVNRKLIRGALITAAIICLAGSSCDPPINASKPVEGNGPLPAPVPTLVATPVENPTTEPKGGVVVTPENIKGLVDYTQIVFELNVMMEQMGPNGPLSLAGLDNGQLDFRAHDFNKTTKLTWISLNRDPKTGETTYYLLDQDQRLVQTKIPTNLPQEYKDQKPNIVPVFNLQGGKRLMLMNGDNNAAFGTFDIKKRNWIVFGQPFDMTKYLFEPGTFVVDFSTIPAVPPTPEAPTVAQENIIIWDSEILDNGLVAVNYELAAENDPIIASLMQATGIKGVKINDNYVMAQGETKTVQEKILDMHAAGFVFAWNDQHPNGFTDETQIDPITGKPKFFPPNLTLDRLYQEPYDYNIEILAWHQDPQNPNKQIKSLVTLNFGQVETIRTEITTGKNGELQTLALLGKGTNLRWNGSTLTYFMSPPDIGKSGSQAIFNEKNPLPLQQQGSSEYSFEYRNIIAANSVVNPNYITSAFLGISRYLDPETRKNEGITNSIFETKTKNAVDFVTAKSTNPISLSGEQFINDPIAKSLGAKWDGTKKSFAGFVNFASGFAEFLTQRGFFAPITE